MGRLRARRRTPVRLASPLRHRSALYARLLNHSRSHGLPRRRQRVKFAFQQLQNWPVALRRPTRLVRRATTAEDAAVSQPYPASNDHRGSGPLQNDGKQWVAAREATHKPPSSLSRPPKIAAGPLRQPNLYARSLKTAPCCLGRSGDLDDGRTARPATHRAACPRHPAFSTERLCTRVSDAQMAIKFQNELFLSRIGD